MTYQKEIAERAGVSRATVSRAFTQSANVSPNTLSKIQKAMSDMGLKPISWFLSGTESGKRFILVIAGDISNFFYARIIKGICEQCDDLGVQVVVYNSNFDAQAEEERIEYAAANHYLGVILVTAIEHPIFSYTVRNIQMPVIFVNRYIHSVEADVVCINNFMGGYMAAGYLLEKGHRRIAHVATQKESTPQQDRVYGFAAAMKELRPTEYQYDIYYGEMSVERGREFANELLRREMPYTALFVADCQIAVGIVNSIHDAGYRVPEDLSILCFDDSPYIDESGLALSTIKYDPGAMGRAAVNMLMQRISTPRTEKNRLYLVPQLVERRSVRDLGQG